MDAPPDNPTSEMKRALLRIVIGLQSEGTLLDTEDQEMLVLYHMGEITKGELDNYAIRKADCLRFLQ